MTNHQDDEHDISELGTAHGGERPDSHVGPKIEAPVDPAVADPHGSTDPISDEEYVGRRGGIQGLVDSVAYWAQYTTLSLYGTAAQSKEADPIERLKRKYGRPGRIS